MAPVVIGAATPLFGASWGPDNTILFGQPQGVMRVSAGGGTPELVIKANEGEQVHGPPLLPDGDSVLFSVTTGRGPTRWDQAQIAVQSLRTGERKVVLRGGSDARYVATGDVVYALGETLLAIAFGGRSQEERFLWSTASCVGWKLRYFHGEARGVSDAVLGNAFSRTGGHVFAGWALARVLVRRNAGRAEIYVTPYPGPGGKIAISPGGGRSPRFSSNGRELFSRNGGQVMVVAVEPGPTLRAGTPRLLFEADYVRELDNTGAHNYDVSRDGQRFLMIAPAVNAARDIARARIIVVQNWVDELRRRVPVP